MRAVDAMEDLGRATTAQIAAHEDVDLTRRQVFNHLEELRDRGHLDRGQDLRDGRRAVWRDESLDRLGEYGEADLDAVDLNVGDRGDLDDDEVQENSRVYVYTWNFLNRGDDCGDPPRIDAVEGPAPESLATTGGDPPPREAD